MTRKVKAKLRGRPVGTTKANSRRNAIMVRLDDATIDRWQTEANARHEGNMAAFVRLTVNGALDAKESKDHGQG